MDGHGDTLVLFDVLAFHPDFVVAVPALRSEAALVLRVQTITKHLTDLFPSDTVRDGLVVTRLGVAPDKAAVGTAAADGIQDFRNDT